MKKKIKLHIIGTHGVPAKYGGFETLADFLCQHLDSDFSITVYCNSSKYPRKEKKYYTADLKYINLDASGVQGILYDFITYIKALFVADVILYLSPVGSGFMTPLNLFFRKKVIVNHGGLNEWEREKLSFIQKCWAKFNHRVAAKFSTINIADNYLYKDSLKCNFNAEAEVIRYGGDHVNCLQRDDVKYAKKYPFITNGEKYAVSVSRAQIDNNLHVVLEAFESFKEYRLVLIANWDVSDYGKELKSKYSNHSSVMLLDAIYDKEELDYIRGNAFVYIHSHSRCGTAPSLVEAMNLGNAIVSYDVETNRETTHSQAFFFNNSASLRNVLEELSDKDLEINRKNMKEIATENYTWSIVASEYNSLIRRVL